MIKIKSILKKVSVLIIILMFISAFSSSYTSFNIDNLAFVVALGIDKSDTKNIKVTFQFVNLPSSSEGSNKDSKIVIDSVDASSISNAINIMNAYLARKVDLSHCKMIIFSEELAKDGLSEYIYSLMNDVSVRPSSNIIVSKCTASYYLENASPTLESIVTIYYDTFPDSSKYTGYIANATIGDFFNALVCEYCQPYAILGGINNNSDTTSNDRNANSNDSSIKPGSSSILGSRNSENIGTAIFKDDKLIGELNAMETICLNILKNDVDSFLVSVQDPEDESKYIDISLNPEKSTKISAKIVNGAPYVSIECFFSAKINSMSKDSKYLESDILSAIENSCNNYLKSTISEFLYRTSLDYKSDVSGIGRHMLCKFKTTQDFSNFNWPANYSNSIFNVNVKTKMDSGFLLTQT